MEKILFNFILSLSTGGVLLLPFTVYCYYVVYSYLVYIVIEVLLPSAVVSSENNELPTASLADCCFVYRASLPRWSRSNQIHYRLRNTWTGVRTNRAGTETKSLSYRGRTCPFAARRQCCAWSLDV